MAAPSGEHTRAHLCRIHARVPSSEALASPHNKANNKTISVPTRAVKSTDSLGNHLNALLHDAESRVYELSGGSSGGGGGLSTITTAAGSSGYGGPMDDGGGLPVPPCSTRASFSSIIGKYRTCTRICAQIETNGVTTLCVVCSGAPAYYWLDDKLANPFKAHQNFNEIRGARCCGATDARMPCGSSI